jgi:cytochrome c oxidase subunit 2
MLVTGTTVLSLLGDATVAQASQTQSDIFGRLFTAFLILGTIVGTVVITYILYNAYKYRSDTETPEGQYDIEEETGEQSVARPTLGEIPTGVGKAGGKKLFLSFGISAIIVVSLVTFAYWNLLLVEGTPSDSNDLEVGVEANQYKFTYEYPSGEEFSNLRVPADRVITMNVTSCDPGECGDPSEGENVNVWHTWSAPDLGASADAIPGMYNEAWFQAEETGNYRAVCRELCGPQHSTMNYPEDIKVLGEEEFRSWCTDNNCMDEEKLDSWLEDTGGESA